ncbi:Oidioi.mRNA.OKI2018_I69.PAR.g9410.t1.cds [Oikopleura dioica]|uniref:Oidioi.mRNA.OKI2018_I69.PAR.g9410.t1.cds n=1 Tax=Oikopleura dioica TaxID=34765 RepID=A0ABN7RPG9_OIKDI|nr:Oidioi.mRNA.OKI2018_I69.PAR.g9410.t1.cds [Oikopleura dioica]
MFIFLSLYSVLFAREPTAEERLHNDLLENYFKDVSPLIALPKNRSIEDQVYRKEICREWIPKIMDDFPPQTNRENTLSNVFYCQDEDSAFEELNACEEWLDFIYLKNPSSQNSYHGKCKVTTDDFFESVSSNEILILKNILNRPLYDHVIDVDLYIELQQINKIELKGAYMDLTFTMYAKWYDSRLKWDEQKYHGVMYTLFEPSEIWTPPIEIMNLVEMIDPRLEYVCEVHKDGTIYEIVKMRALVSCDVDLTLYPFDSQECGLSFATPTMADYKLYFHFHEWNMLNSLQNLSSSVASYEKTHLSLLQGTFYRENTEWALLGYKYSVEPVVGHLKRSYSHVNVDFLLERHKVYYEVTLFIPIVCLNLLVCLGLWMPISCGEAVGFQVTMLLAVVLYLDLLSRTTPVFETINESPRLMILFLLTTVASLISHVILTFSMWKSSPDEDTLHNLSPFKCKFALKMAKFFECLTRQSYKIPNAIELIIEAPGNIERIEDEELKKAWRFYAKMSSHFWATILTFAVVMCTFVIILDLHIQRSIFHANIKK